MRVLGSFLFTSNIKTGFAVISQKYMTPYISQGRVTAIWNDNVDSVFTVLPTECDIQPYKSASFRVNFHPRQPNQFYGADLECTAFYKVEFVVIFHVI